MLPECTVLIAGLAGAVTVQTGVLTTTWAITGLTFYLASVSYIYICRVFRADPELCRIVIRESLHCRLYTNE